MWPARGALFREVQAVLVAMRLHAARRWTVAPVAGPWDRTECSRPNSTRTARPWRQRALWSLRGRGEGVCVALSEPPPSHTSVCPLFQVMMGRSTIRGGSWNPVEPTAAVGALTRLEVGGRACRAEPVAALEARGPRVKAVSVLRHFTGLRFKLWPSNGIELFDAPPLPPPSRALPRNRPVVVFWSRSRPPSSAAAPFFADACGRFQSRRRRTA